MNENPLHFIPAEKVILETSPWTLNEWLCRPDMADASQLMMVRATMPPGCSHPFHRHPHREEIIHIVSGRAEQWVDREYRILHPGEIAVIPKGGVHATYNPFPEPLVFHAILSPGVLEPGDAEDLDPLDVSGEEPWKSLRAGMPQCTILADLETPGK